MTNGQITLRDSDDKKRQMILYAWHDGHTGDALRLLMELPFTIFAWAKATSRDWMQDKERTPGPWFYDNIIRSTLESFVEERRNGYKTKEDLLSYWMALIPLDLYMVSLAHWISRVRFDVWNIVPDESWCSYPGADLIVDVFEQRANGEYHITVPCDDEEAVKHYLEIADESIAAFNARLTDKDCHIRYEQKRQQLNGKKNGFAFPKIVVPIIPIIQELMWQDIVTARAVIQGEKQDDEFKTAALTYMKEYAERMKQIEKEIEEEQKKKAEERKASGKKSSKKAGAKNKSRTRKASGKP